MKSGQAHSGQGSKTQVQPYQAVRRDFLRTVRDALELLLRDIELRDEKEYEFFYVVDFAAIYAYLYRTSDHHFIQVPGESADETFARLQLALETLFIPSQRKLVLIPPYLDELDSHLTMLQTRDALASAGIKAYFMQAENVSTSVDALSRLIQNSAVFNEYLKTRDVITALGKRGYRTLKVNVSHEKRQVTLMGEVDTKEDKDQTEEIARIAARGYAAPEVGPVFLRAAMNAVPNGPSNSISRASSPEGSRSWTSRKR